MPKLYFDLNQYQREIQKHYNLLAISTTNDASNILKDLFLFILKNYEDGIIGSKNLAYDIAGTMQFEAAKSEKFKELIELAGELELPDEHISGDPEERFAHLLSMIKNL